MDMLAASNLLKKAGASPELAEALVQVVTDLSHVQVATKQDIAALKVDIAELETRLIKTMGAGFVITIGILGTLMTYLQSLK
jgi:hypothetical protein